MQIPSLDELRRATELVRTVTPITPPGPWLLLTGGNVDREVFLAALGGA